MGEMCAPTGERHGRDVWSNRREAWERCVLQQERGMGEMCGPIGEQAYVIQWQISMGEMCGPTHVKHGRCACVVRNWTTHLSHASLWSTHHSHASLLLEHTSLPCLSPIGPHNSPMPLSYWTSSGTVSL